MIKLLTCDGQRAVESAINGHAAELDDDTET
jgi:hypothetical protein